MHETNDLNDGEVAGVGIFNPAIEKVEAITAGDRAVEAGVLRCEVRPVRGSAGDRLPA
jgi:hypothetical protein